VFRVLWQLSEERDGFLLAQDALHTITECINQINDLPNTICDMLNRAGEGVDLLQVCKLRFNKYA
jgi:hypothetical protein